MKFLYIFYELQKYVYAWRLVHIVEKYESIYTSFLEKLLASPKLCVMMTILSSFLFLCIKKRIKVCTAFWTVCIMHPFFALCYHYFLGIHLLFFDRWLKFKQHPKRAYLLFTWKSSKDSVVRVKILKILILVTAMILYLKRQLF